MQLKTIVAGTDFSPPSRAAVREAAGLALRSGARLILVHAGRVPSKGEVPLTTPPGRAHTRPGGAPRGGPPPQLAKFEDEYEKAVYTQFHEVHEALRELAEEVSAMGVSDVDERVVDGYTDEALVETAQSESASLLVLGSRGLHGFKRMMLGSVSQQVLRHLPCPVLVARRQESANRGYDRILVAVDFSPVSEKLGRTAAELASADGAIDLFHAWEIPGATWATYEAWANDLFDRDSARRSIAERGAKLIDALPKDVTVDFIEAEGQAHRAIHERLEHGNYDLVVIGSHGHRGVRRWLLGSVAEATVRHSSCSVLVVPAPKRKG